MPESESYQRLIDHRPALRRAWLTTGRRVLTAVAVQHRTEVRVLYDEQALYVGARMYDDPPDAIARTMASCSRA